MVYEAPHESAGRDGAMNGNGRNGKFFLVAAIGGIIIGPT
jgi:hypothetical protein